MVSLKSPKSVGPTATHLNVKWVQFDPTQLVLLVAFSAGVQTGGSFREVQQLPTVSLDGPALDAFFADFAAKAKALRASVDGPSIQGAWIAALEAVASQRFDP